MEEFWCSTLCQNRAWNGSWYPRGQRRSQLDFQHRSIFPMIAPQLWANWQSPVLPRNKITNENCCIMFLSLTWRPWHHSVKPPCQQRSCHWREPPNWGQRTLPGRHNQDQSAKDQHLHFNRYLLSLCCTQQFEENWRDRKDAQIQLLGLSDLGQFTVRKHNGFHFKVLLKEHWEFLEV